MTQMTCAQCGQPINAGKYFLAGIDLRQSPPASVYVHNNGCRHEWEQEHPGNVLRGEGVAHNAH